MEITTFVLFAKELTTVLFPACQLAGLSPCTLSTEGPVSRSTTCRPLGEHASLCRCNDKQKALGCQ